MIHTNHIKLYIMYTNFEEYWDYKKDIFTSMGVDKTTAHTIWLDACNLVIVMAEKNTV